MVDSPLRLLKRGRPVEFATGERCHITEWLNLAGLPEVSLAEARVEPGVTTELHALDMRELYIIREGTGRMDAGDGLAIDVAPGTVVEIPAGVSQRITNTGPADLVFFCLCLPRFRPGAYRAREEA